MTDPPASRVALPHAAQRPEHRLSAVWLVPVVVLAFAAWLGWRAWSMRGVSITIALPDGHGLSTGDAVIHRGIAVGEVSGIHLDDALEGVIVEVSLSAHADRIARRGSQFWVVRPRIDLRGIQGLETITGGRYITVRPGRPDAPEQRRFIGLGEAPVVADIDADDLEVILEGSRRAGLAPGAPVTYRQFRIGTVLSIGLANDGGSVEARVHVEKAYAGLVRAGSRFWSTGGISAEVGLGGLSVDVDSLEALVAGSIAMATPPPLEAGAEVATGHRFRLAERPEAEWLRWKPLVAIGSSLLPRGATSPDPQRARITWRQGRLIRRERTRNGWVLPMEDGLLGPADLLQPSEDAREGSVVLEVSGTVVPLEAPPIWSENGLALLDVALGERPWPDRFTRRPEAPEDCVAIADRTAAALPLAAARLAADGGDRWSVDDAVSVSREWHGAAVVARSDGRLVGILLLEDDVPHVALLGAPGGEAGEEDE